MAKIKLGARPKSFKRTVTFDLPEGGKAAIECTFRYRTRKEFGEFIDRLVGSANAGARADEERNSLAEILERISGANADYLLDVLDGWNLEEELNKANAQQFADEFPGGATAIMEQYRSAVQDGRLGN